MHVEAVQVEQRVVGDLVGQHARLAHPLPEHLGRRLPPRGRVEVRARGEGGGAEGGGARVKSASEESG